MKTQQIIETALYAANLDQAREFYSQVLGLEVVGEEAGRHVFFRCGEAILLIFNPDATDGSTANSSSSRAPRHGARGSGHTAFRMDEREIEAWREHLERFNVVIESEVTWPQGGHSLYFRDPAGNCIELVTPILWGLS